MPPLFQLDNYDACLVRNGTFCLGTFHLSAPDDNQLYRLLQWVSSNARHRFNHTQLHRGLCLSTSCINVSNVAISPKQQFQQCVNNITRSQYGLEASMLRLDYCKDAQTPASVPLDVADDIFLALCIALLAANILGTLYDIFRHKTNKGNQLLLSWSLISNYRNFTRIYPNEDTIVSRVNSIHALSYNNKFGAKIKDIRFIGRGEKKPNSPSKVITPDDVYSRILPLYMFMVSFMATWSRFIADGTMWIPIMEKEAQVCRMKWWSHALFINNIYRPDDRCLVQTWFIAVDMQLYALSIVLAISLTRWTKVVIKIIPLLFLVSVLCNFVAAYSFNFKAVLYLSNPEYLKKLHYGMPSFKLMYAAPWTSIPATLLGVATAYLYYEMRNNKIDLHEYKIGHWLVIVLMTYLTSILLHLLIEMPVQKFLRAALGI
ncbi:unnamed protein product [Pieris brassicae]|uniref:Acyltransferase 3 domain-containing protein n=1 Tax=Pieris brassicae TaxID=7116 RepID=A0A9P0TFF0_PIEBR|nr:unnamed protein product [Pieris brassicae]